MNDKPTCPNCGMEMHPSDAVRHGYGGPTHEANRCIWLLRDRVATLEEAMKPAPWDDSPLPEDEAIDAAFPSRSDSHETYAEAMRLVGARHSKQGLVALVNWLLFRLEEQKAIDDLLFDASGDLGDVEHNIEQHTSTLPQFTRLLAAHLRKIDAVGEARRQKITDALEPEVKP